MPDAVALDLLRHGETGHAGFRGRTDDPLTPTGLEQMRAAVRSAGPWQAVVSSPLGRCAAFARELAEAARLPLELDPRLAEIDFGDWEGRDAAQLMESDAERLARFWDDPWQFTPPGGEPMAAFERRVCAAWAELSERHAGRPVLVVSHGGVIRLLLCLDRGLQRSELLNIAVPHASLHRIGGAR